MQYKVVSEDKLSATYTEYRLYFERIGNPGSGFSFPCDADGNPDEDRPAESRANLAACLAGTNGTRRVGVEKYESTVMLCSCGSGEQPYKVHDGHGIYLTHACGDECEGKKLAKFRPDIMSRYDADEPIEPNY